MKTYAAYHNSLTNINTRISELIENDSFNEDQKSSLLSIKTKYIDPMLNHSTYDQTITERNEISFEVLSEIIETISCIVNNMSFDYQLAATRMFEKFCRTHRTLQQDTIRLLAAFISKIAQSDYDLRNEAAVKWSKEVNKIDAYFPHV